jgi:hypothetical protein
LAVAVLLKACSLSAWPPIANLTFWQAIQLAHRRRENVPTQARKKGTAAAVPCLALTR